MSAKDILSQFNAVITGDFSSNSDVEGRLVANSINGAATFYIPRNTAAASTFAAVNAVTVAAGVNGNVDSGGNVDVQGTNGGRFSFNGGGYVAGPAFAISDFSAPLSALTTQLSGLAANSTIDSSDPNNFTFNATPNASGQATFMLSTASLSSARNLQFNFGAATTIIVDVTGSSFVDTVNFNGSDYLNSHVIWDFADATNLSFTNWHGTVLAPLATVSNSNAMEGDLFAKNFRGSGELHDFTFKGSVPAASTPGSVPTVVPEPSTAVLLGAAVSGLWLVRFRRQTVRDGTGS